MTKLDGLMASVEAGGRLQEYRTALITAAVTGKIDARKTVRHEGSTNQVANARLPA